MDPNPHDVLQKLRQLGDKVKQMSLDEVADYLGILDHEGRMRFKQSCVSAQAPWKEAKDGITCDCSGNAVWLCRKGSFVQDGLGYDVFPFKCEACGKITERKWRAPSLDGLVFQPYVTRYTMDQSSGER